MIPDLIVASPRDENELQHLLYTAIQSGKPMAVRYPRSVGLGVRIDKKLKEIPIARSEVLRTGADAFILAIGSMVDPSLKASDILQKQGIEAGVVDLRYAKPLDTALLDIFVPGLRCIVTAEENVLSGGVGCSINSLLQQAGLTGMPVYNIGIPDKFVEHGPQSVLRSRYGLDAVGIADKVKAMLESSSSCSTGAMNSIEVVQD
jgi:1-deoxy-D-xylulose-5-phosphate synthase